MLVDKTNILETIVLKICSNRSITIKLSEENFLLSKKIMSLLMDCFQICHQNCILHLGSKNEGACFNNECYCEETVVPGPQPEPELVPELKYR